MSNISKTIQDRAVLTMVDWQEFVYCLLNAIFSDLE